MNMSEKQNALFLFLSLLLFFKKIKVLTVGLGEKKKKFPLTLWDLDWPAAN